MMNLDPRPVANVILDIADEMRLGLSNFHLNKVLYFSQAERLAFNDKPLFKLTFEAWQHGPILPVIYHEFKSFGSESIRARATILCKETGERVLARYDDLELDYNFLRRIVSEYGAMSFSALYAVAHQRGGAWDVVWNERSEGKFGMTIPNDLIKETFTGNLGGNSLASESPSRGRYVH
ncbi:Panacea domain-containing protein [Maricaulis sp. CAU 1757]